MSGSELHLGKILGRETFCSRGHERIQNKGKGMLTNPNLLVPRWHEWTVVLDALRQHFVNRVGNLAREQNELPPNRKLNSRVPDKVIAWAADLLDNGSSSLS